MLERKEISSARAAAVFHSPRQRRILLSLIDAERPLSQLALLCETPLNLLHHHVAKLVRLGLVKVARTQRRAGAPMRFYRAVARSFYVPAELLPADPGGALRIRMRALLDESVAGALYSHDGRGPRMQLQRSGDSLASELWLELRLGKADAAALTSELRALLHRYEARGKRSQRRWLVHAALAPIRE